ncbi:MAG TPA: AlpA family phage regulatory protein [Allosphingosinicella sp.]|jgi:prophage regulatory protein
MSDPLLRRRDVEAEVGLKKSAIYEMIARAEFPEGVKVTSRARRWRLSEIEAWKRSRPSD